MPAKKVNRYGTPGYLTQSELNHYISYNEYGEVDKDIIGYLYPIPPVSSAITIGRIADEHFTEGKDFYNLYMKDLTVEELKGKGAEGKTKAELMRSYQFIHGAKSILTGTEYEAIDTIIKRINSIAKIRNTIKKVSKQTIFEDHTLKIKGKLDFLTKDAVIDLKCVGSMQNFMSSLMYRGVLVRNHRYIRQLAWYCYLSGRKIGRLIVVDYTGEIKYLEFGEEILTEAWTQILIDIAELRAIKKPSLITRLG